MGHEVSCKSLVCFLQNGLWFSDVCSSWILLKIAFGMFDYGKWNASLPEALKLKKEAKTGFVYIVILIMRNWRQCIGNAMDWHLFIFSSFSMRVFIRITCFLWWNIYFFYAPFTTKFLFQEKLWPLNISLVMSNLIKCEPSMIWNSRFDCLFLGKNWNSTSLKTFLPPKSFFSHYSRKEAI